MHESSFSHQINGCDECQRYQADMRVEPDTGKDAAKWCHRCAGRLLKKLTNSGSVAKVRAFVPTVEPTDREPEMPPDPGWTVDLSIDVLTRATPRASKLVRVLLDEGGRATPARLKKLLGVGSLSGILASLNAASRHYWRARGGFPKGSIFVATPRPFPGTRSVADKVHSYALPAGTAEIWSTALRRLGR